MKRASREVSVVAEAEASGQGLGSPSLGCGAEDHVPSEVGT